MTGDNGGTQAAINLDTARAYVGPAPTLGASSDGPRQVQPAAQTMTILRLALQLLADRSYPWVTLLMVGGFFAYAITHPSTERIVTAALFTVLAHVPTWGLWRRKG